MSCVVHRSCVTWVLCDVPLPVSWSLGAGPAQTQTSPSQGVRNVASVCLQIGYPTIASVPHSIVNGYKRVLAVAVETDYSFPLAEKVTATADLQLWGCRGSQHLQRVLLLW